MDVLVCGCFNVLHADHIRLLEFANQFGQVVVGLNGNRYQQVKYGSQAVPVEDRLYTVMGCRWVVGAVVFEEDHPGQLIRQLRPRVYCRGPDYLGRLLPEQPALDEVGCRLEIRSGTHQYSATQLSQARTY